jgi:hypothetical protein
MGEVESLAKRLARVRSVAHAAEGGAEVDEGAGVFQACAGAFELGDCQFQQVDSVSCLLDQSEGA